MTSYVRHRVFSICYLNTLVPCLYLLIMCLGGLKPTVKEIWSFKVANGGHFEFMLINHFPGV